MYSRTVPMVGTLNQKLATVPFLRFVKYWFACYSCSQRYFVMQKRLLSLFNEKGIYLRHILKGKYYRGTYQYSIVRYSYQYRIFK